MSPNLFFRLPRIVGLCGLLLLVGVVIGCGGASNTTTETAAPGGSVPKADHVFLVVLENHSFSTVIGSPAMPYLNSLATKFGLAANYFANAHPSLPNYFMLTVGQEITPVDSFTGIVTNDNIVRALTASGKTWKAYDESLPSTGYTGDSVTPLYLKEHNPFAFLSDVLDSSSQAANIVPLSQLSSDLSAGTLPDFGFLLPNAEDDAHTCPGGAAACPDTDLLAAADGWLKNNIDPLINSPNFGNSVLIITWDESIQSDTANGGGHVATVLVGPQVKAGFSSTTFYQHQSTLRVIMDLLQVNDLPNDAANAPSMAEFFQ